ncbi:MAG: AAA family ATPase [Isosphaerales bacterium]
MPDPLICWGVARWLSDAPLNGELDAVSGPYRRLLDHLAGLPAGERQGAFNAFLMRETPEEEAAIIKAVADQDPKGPPPAPKVKRLTAHLGDLAGFQSTNRMLWLSWLVRGHFNLLSSDPKIGKTHLMLELARRLWFGLAWPDGQPATLSAGTRTLWVCGDRHQDELRERAAAFGLPPEALLLNASPDEPYGGWNLDDPKNVDALGDRVVAEKPGVVVIDTVWRATRRRLCKEDEVNGLLDPLITMAQQCDTTLVGLMHLSKDHETLGRRLEGLARAILKLFKPDPAQRDRRKLIVTGNFKEAPPLGVTLRDGGCDFDSNPPEELVRNLGGRPPEKLDKALAFLEEKLANGDRKAVELINEWEALGEAKGTIFNARKSMQAEGRLVVDDFKKPQIWHLVRTPSQEPSQGQEPGF